MARVSSLAGTALCLTAVVAVAAPTAAADASTTVTSFTLGGGSLSVAQGSGSLAQGAPAEVSATVPEAVVVHDTRGSTLGWTAYATSTAAAPGLALAVSYSSGAVTATGSVTATSLGATQLGPDPVPVVVGTGVTGNNSASWTPRVVATLDGAPAGPGARSAHGSSSEQAWKKHSKQPGRGSTEDVRADRPDAGTVMHSVL